MTSKDDVAVVYDVATWRSNMVTWHPSVRHGAPAQADTRFAKVEARSRLARALHTSQGYDRLLLGLDFRYTVNTIGFGNVRA